MIPGIVAAQHTYAAPPSGGDPYWSNVVSLLHFDGTHDSTTFPDQTGRAWSASNFKVSTGQSKFGGASGRSDYTIGSYLTTAHSTDWDFGSGAFTVEFWLYLPAYRSGGRGLFSRRISATYCPLELSVNGAGNITVLVANAANTSWAVIETFSGIVVPTGAWKHVALTGDGTKLRLFMDGSKSATEPSYSGLANSTQAVYIGRGGDGGADIYIDDFRATKGVARYAASFTPPSDPFPNS